MPKVLWETTLNSGGRDDCCEWKSPIRSATDRIINELMEGRVSAPRFIMERAEEAEELDV
jgi:hypothetical protein